MACLVYLAISSLTYRAGQGITERARSPLEAREKFVRERLTTQKEVLREILPQREGL